MGVHRLTPTRTGILAQETCFITAVSAFKGIGRTDVRLALFVTYSNVLNAEMRTDVYVISAELCLCAPLLHDFCPPQRLGGRRPSQKNATLLPKYPYLKKIDGSVLNRL